MNDSPLQGSALASRLSLFSLIAGILGLVSCCNPPIQLICGSSAAILAWLSRTQQPLTPRGVIGLVLGILSIIISILVFFQFMWAMEIIEDPANAELIRQFYQQTQEMMESMMPTQAP